MKVSVIAVLAVFAVVAQVGAQTGLHSAPMQVLHGKPYVMAMVNGHGPYRFILDTGTGAEAIVTPELASVLQLPATGTTRLDDPSGRSGRSAPVRRIETLSVAGVEFYAVRAVEHALLNGDGPCDGMLGFTLFKGLLLTLDYPHSLITVEDGELEPDGDLTVHPFRMPQGVPVVDITIGGVRIGALLDSGGAGLSLPERLVSRLRFSAEPTDFARAESLSSRFPVKVGKLATDVHLGDITFDQPWIEINPAFPQANFGSVPMQHFAITFDQDNLLVRFDGPRKRINLGVTPSPVRLTTDPLPLPPDTKLVPIG
jgi:predicted aspartyl protease